MTDYQDMIQPPSDISRGVAKGPQILLGFLPQTYPIGTRVLISSSILTRRSNLHDQDLLKKACYCSNTTNYTWLVKNK